MKCKEWLKKITLFPNVLDKDRNFTWALIIVFVVIFIASLVSQHIIFTDIVKVSSIPLLFFALCDTAVSTLRNVYNRANSLREGAEENAKNTGTLKEISEIYHEEYKDADDGSDWEKTRSKKSNRHAEQLNKVVTYDRIMALIKQKKVIGVVYIASIVILLCSLIFTPLLAQYFGWASHTSLPLLSMLITIAVALRGEDLTQKLLEHYYDKVSKSYFESNEKNESEELENGE